ncbi:hypothetical protein [Acidicapsa acidisoli]|uniref:hypothetical protein n=1 Tax=Acidicapsa acidisoli TaxID=1615681 RepID=UPI0021E025AB|nr:hypothetical protein [Acidicapsa acidisoli]
MDRRDRRISPASAAALLLLSLLLACSVLKTDLMSGLALDPLPPLERQVIPLALLALAAATIVVMRQARWPDRRQLWIPALIGLGLFVAPGVLVSFSSRWVSGPTRTGLLTLVSVFAVVLEPYVGLASEAQRRGGLAAALLAVVGTLFVFPVAIPASVEAGGAFVAVAMASLSIAAANCLGVAAARLRGHSHASFAAIVAVAASTAAIANGLAGALLERSLWKWNAPTPELLWSIAVEMPALLLLFWLMPRLSATQMASRFIWAPVLAILAEATVFQLIRQLRPRTWLGLFLMAAGATWLLFAPGEEASTNVLPLKLEL